jgi:predicted polyphosphate/ATP-dependent NAD kinase
MKKVGLIVNPVAGMGGSVGLKGTDGEMYKKAVELGATPITPQRVEDALSLVKRKDLHFIVAPDQMGEKYIRKFSFEYETISKIAGTTSAGDTERIAREMLEKGVDLLIFVGGDGTARDICNAVGFKVPVVAIPSGVKMFSPVFALSPYAAAEMINSFEDRFIEKEVLDIDEDAFRENRLAAELYGYLKVPKSTTLLQGKKESSNVTQSEEHVKEGIADYLIENLDKDTLYILGPGTTLNTIARKMQIEKTLLGIDAVYKSMSVGTDLNEKALSALIAKYNTVKIIVTPIGGNGFIFGRGSTQFTPEVLRSIGSENIIIVATEDKISKLESLRVDTGNIEIDKSLSGFKKVITGYKKETIIEVKC